MNASLPSEETLRVKLAILWKDLFHVRHQTWKTLEIESLLVIGLIAADLNIPNKYASYLIGGIITLSVFAGIRATLHHRKTQIRILTPLIV